MAELIDSPPLARRILLVTDAWAPQVNGVVRTLERLVEEREYGEIAARLECSEQVVRQRVHRGLKTLRANLREEA